MKAKMIILAASSTLLFGAYANATTEHIATSNNQEVTAVEMHQDLHSSMLKMKENMSKGMAFNHPDYAFAAGMLPHHVGAVDMAKVELQYGKDPQMIQLAKNIIAAQDKEIKEMQYWLAEHKTDSTQKTDKISQEMHKELKISMQKMQHNMMQGMSYNDPDVAFAAGMLPHHVGAVDMAKVELKYGKNPQMRQLAKNIIAAQGPEIKEMKEWLKQHSTN